MCDIVIAEGAAKIREGKQWKSRWLVLRKPSPVADCLVLYVYKERGVKERCTVTLEHICGLEAHACSDGVFFILSIICLHQTPVLGFDSREALLNWDLRLRYCLGEVHSYNVSVLPGTKLESGPATLHLCNDLLVIAKDQPPVITGHWNLLELRRYGPVSNGFVFEGGTRCGSWAGVFLLACSEGEQISFLFDCIVRGISPSRGPLGLKPLLPECGTSAVSVQDRLNHEAEKLERKLCRLCHSTASNSSVGSSLTGDTCSTSGSSDSSETSQSGCSVSGHPAQWTESIVLHSSERSHPLPPRTTSESLNDEIMEPVRLRNLKDTGRQSSSDSGIATGSHSSYTGSFSSNSDSLDASGPGEEYGTLLNLPPPTDPEKRLCTCRPSPTHEYQVPSSLRYLYDTPRRLLEITRTSEASINKCTRTSNDATLVDRGKIELSIRTQSKDCSECPNLIHIRRTEKTLELDKGEGLKKEEGLKRSSWSKLMCSHPAANHKSLFTKCHSCGGLKRTHLTGMASLPLVPAGKPSAPATRDATDEPPYLEDIRKPIPSWMISPEPSHIDEERRSDGNVSCLADVLANYCPDDLCSVNTSGYESMALSLVPVGPKSRHPTQSAHVLLYENCRHCRRGENSCHLPKPTPPSRGQECFLKDQIKDLRNHLNGSESICFSAEHLSVSLQRISEEDKRAEKGRSDSVYEIMDGRATERSSETEEKSRYELMRSCGGSHLDARHLTEGGVFSLSGDDLARGDLITYVNIPISPMSKKQLNYMDVELQESSTAIRGRNSSPYTQIDITATDAAHRAGTQHALGREEGRQRLEQRTRGGLSQ